MPFPKKASPPGQDHQNSLAQAAALQRIAGKAARIGGWTIELPRRKLTWSDEIRAIHEVPDGFTPTLEDAIEFYPPEYRAEVTRKVEACIHEGRPFDFELEIITSKKRRLWIRAVGEPVRDEAGTITSIQGAFQDITPGKLAEQSAAEIEARFRRLSESLPFIVWTATTEGRVDYANHHFYKYAGLPEEADPAASWPAMVHPQDLQPSIDAWTHSLEQESIYTTDLRLLRHADQAWRWHRIHAAPIRDAKGAIALWCGTALDIHETHRLQAESNRLATRLTTTLESITDAVFTLDPEWRFTYLNAEAERLLRRDRASLLGRCVWDEFPEAVGSTFDKQYRLARAQNRTVNFEEFFPPLDSWFDVRAFPSNEGLTVYFRDITEHRRLQHQFLRTQRMESLGTLAGGIAHDLNNLLSPILMGTSLLRNWQSTEDGRKLVDQIERSARRGADLVKQVLTFARGTTGNRGPVDAGELLRELASIVTTTFPKNIEVRLKGPDNLPPLLADSTQIHQVLVNLCLNARDAMPDGGRLTLHSALVTVDAVRAARHPEVAPGSFLCITVEDTGKGMEPAVQERIFEPFFTTKPLGEGTGLGLSTVMGIVRSHGGFISVLSKPGGGSSFQVHLPLAETPAPDANPPARANPPPDPPPKTVRILLVDDEEAIRITTGAALESSGYEVITAAEGSEALALFVRDRPGIHLVITDLMMPDLDGIGLVTALRRMAPDLKIITTTGQNSLARNNRIRQLGVRHFLLKPYTAEELLHTVNAALNST